MNFIASSVVRWNGSDRATTFQSATQLQADIAAGDVAAAGSASVTVFNPAPGGGTSNSVAFTVNNPLPAVTLLTPADALAGDADFTLEVTGMNFVPGSVVRWGGANRTTTFVSSTELTAEIPASDLAVAGTSQVTVFNPGPGGGTSGPRTFSVNNPVPGVSLLFPSSALAGEAGFSLQVTGSNFVPGSIVRWDGADRPTTFVAGGLLTAAILASDIATGSTPQVTVFNPGPGGGNSGPLAFTVNNPVPVLDSLNPTDALAGGGAFTLQVAGSNFVSGSIVRWDGSDRPTTFVSSTELTAAIPASDLAVAGTSQVTVFNPAPGGGTSGSLEFTVNNPVPVLDSLNPTDALTGGGAFTLQVAGSNFVSGSVVRWDGADRPTTFVSSTELTAEIAAAEIASGAVAQVRVFNPGPGGGPSGSLAFTVNNPVPVLDSLNPTDALAGSGAFTLEVTGSNFVPGSVVQWEGANRTTMFVSSTQLTAAIEAGDVAQAGVFAVTVFNPAPAGGTSNPINFSIENPVPVLDSLSASCRVAGGTGFTLTVHGSQFVSDSVVRWDGSDRATTFVSGTEITASILASDIVNAGTAQVTVFNPVPGGGSSGGLEFTIAASGGNPTLTLNLFRVDNGGQVPDADKATVGTTLSNNNDDDDDDAQPDNADLIINGVEDRRDMARLELNVVPSAGLCGEIRLAADTAGLVRVFNENDAAVALPELLDASRFSLGDIPYQVEGLGAGDVFLTFSFDDGVAPKQEQVKLVVGAEVEILLTFDDGPDSTEPLADNLTQKVLDTLLENRVQDGILATFFIQTHISFRGGNEVGQGRIMAQGAAGHHVEIHTGNGGDPDTEVDHALHTDRVLEPAYDVDGDMVADGLNALESDLIRAKARILEFTGRTPLLVRPPNGLFNQDVLDTYERVNLTMQLWDIDSEDTGACPGPGDLACLLANVRTEIQNKIDVDEFSQVILFHDIKEVTANNLETILKAIEDAIQHRGRNVDFRQF